MRKCPPGSISEPIPSSTTKVWSERQTLVVIARVALSRLGGMLQSLGSLRDPVPFLAIQGLERTPPSQGRDCARRAIPEGGASTPWFAARPSSFLAGQGLERAPIG